MASTTIGGCKIQYEVLGTSGPPIALTPGGRAAKEATLPLAETLAKQCRVLVWDRRNCGASDVYIGPERSEQELWADDLAEVLPRLGMAPAYVMGGSAGSRVSLLTAIRHPKVVKALTLWSVSGGPFASQVLGHDYHVPFMRAAQAGGMAAVAKTAFFGERIATNPANRERLLAMDPEQFAETMMRWDAFFYPQPDMPTIGTTESQLRGIRAPTLVFEGNDDIHCKEASDAVARLVPGAVYVPCPWTREDFIAHYTGKRTGGIMQSLYPIMTLRILAFIEQAEGKR